ncbi:hypothetical protein [Luteimonas aquatica]|uniref:hypothetical protein n=1 Tax=Luteimonas aquatica TaxID=450364 RepID=UPI001F55CA6B|nr:hypothetical protein [Luteimonas aquatica]
MRIATLLSLAVLLLAGCKIEAGAVTTTHYSIDGVGVNSTRSRVFDGNGVFDCVQSVSGQCHFVLFTEQCRDRAGNAGADAARPDHRACTAHVVQAFSLKAGTSKRLDRLPKDLQQCVGHQSAPTAPDCLQPTG